MKLNRRRLIAGAAASAAAAASAPIRAGTAGDPCEAPRRWDQTWDVIVIGAGGAGLAAGIAAREAGARTIVLEKMAFPGGNTIISGGGISAALPEPGGPEDSPELHARQTLEAGDYRGDPELVRTLCEGAPESVRWLRRIGVRFRPGVYQTYGGLWPRCRSPEERSGAEYVRAGVAHANRIGLEILTGHKVVRILRERPLSGRVVGIEVSVGGERRFMRATRGVVAAAGGFAANDRMCGLCDPRLRDLGTTNRNCSTGEVLRAIQDIGGMAVGLDFIQCVPWRAPGVRHPANLYHSVARAIFVNRDGRRYVAEDGRRDRIRDATLA